jgi:hypothetical protein
VAKPKPKRKPKSPFQGRWYIASISGWDEDFLHEEEPAYIEFSEGQQGEFHFGNVHGSMDCREGQRDGQPAVEFSWEGNAEMDPVTGRGWAVLKEGWLEGMLFFHGGDDSDIVAERA